MLIIQNGIVFGIIISFMLGPAFFILLETSIKKGFKAAVFLDLGILLSDAIYLLAAFFVAEKINIWLTIRILDHLCLPTSRAPAQSLLHISTKDRHVKR